jgi:hypothetical protein
MKGRKTKTQIEYEQIITKVRANIIEIMDQEEAEGEYEEIVDAAKNEWCLLRFCSHLSHVDILNAQFVLMQQEGKL